MTGSRKEGEQSRLFLMPSLDDLGALFVPQWSLFPIQIHHRTCCPSTSPFPGSLAVSSLVHVSHPRQSHSSTSFSLLALVHLFMPYVKGNYVEKASQC